jgi:hypothetical protein
MGGCEPSKASPEQCRRDSHSSARILPGRTAGRYDHLTDQRNFAQLTACSTRIRSWLGTNVADARCLVTDTGTNRNLLAITVATVVISNKASP